MAFDWTIEREIALFQGLKENPPFALERTANLLALSNKLSSQFGVDVTVVDISEKLEQLYGTDTMDSFSFARSKGGQRATHFNIPENITDLHSHMNLEGELEAPALPPLLSTVLPPIDSSKLTTSEDFFLPHNDMMANVNLPPPAPVSGVGLRKGRATRKRNPDEDEGTGIADDEFKEDDDEEEEHETKLRGVVKKRIHRVSAPSPTSSSKKYKKKKFVEPNPRPDGSIDADDVIDLPRLNEMFNRYMACYEDATRDKNSRFGGLTEFVFAILLELKAEEKPVSLTEIYAHAKTIWQKLPEELIKRFQTKDFKGNIRSTLYACQIFIRPGESQEEKKTWMLRGRPDGPIKLRRKERD